VLPGHRGSCGDRERLRFGRARREHVLVCLERPPERVQDPGILGMDHQRQPELGDRRGESRQCAVIRRRLQVRVAGLERVQHLLAAQAERIAEVRLEPECTRGRELDQLLFSRCGTDERPQPEIDTRPRSRQRRLRLQHACRIDGGHGVRHVDHSRHAACGGGGRERAEVLFVGEARVPAVHVHVDAARQQPLARDIDRLSAARSTRPDAGDHAIADGDVEVGRSVRGVDGRSLEQELTGRGPRREIRRQGGSDARRGRAPQRVHTSCMSEERRPQQRR